MEETFSFCLNEFNQILKEIKVLEVIEIAQLDFEKLVIILIKNIEMNSVDFPIQQQPELQLIRQLLREGKNIDIIRTKSNEIDFEQIYHIQDLENEQYYSLRIIPIYEIKSGKQILNANQRDQVQKYAKALSQMNHPHIAKYHSAYQISNYYFIQYESFDLSLKESIEININRPIQINNFLKISLQILEAAQYLQNKDYILQDLSLKNILLDRYGSIKLTTFQYQVQPIEVSLVNKRFQNSLKKNELFYLPPEFLNLNQKLVYMSYKSDVWSIGICLYSLAGAKTSHILQYIQGKELYLYQSNLGSQINSFLVNILQNISTLLRPSIPCLIQQLLNFQSNDQEIIKNKISSKYSTNQNYQNKNVKFQLNLQTIAEEKNEFIRILIYGMKKLEGGDFPLSTFQNCIEMQPDNDIVYTYMAHYYLFKDNSKSLEQCKKAIKINPQNDLIYCFMGQIYHSYKLKNDELFFEKKALQINNKNEYALYLIGTQLIDTSVGESIYYLNKSIEICPSLKLCFDVAKILYHHKEYEETILIFKKIGEMQPQNELLNLNLGNLYHKCFKYNQSVLFYKKSKILHQKMPSFYQGLYKHYLVKQQLENALKNAQAYSKLINIGDDLKSLKSFV